jgi:hypothetical protein
MRIGEFSMLKLVNRRAVGPDQRKKYDKASERKQNEINSRSKKAPPW